MRETLFYLFVAVLLSLGVTAILLALYEFDTWRAT